MTAAVDNVQKLQQDLQNELTNTNQLLMLISEELHKIKIFTNAGGEFEATIKQNASLMATLANMQNLDIVNLPPVARTNWSHQNDQNVSCDQHDSFRSSMDESR